MALPKTENFDGSNGDIGSTYSGWANTNGNKVTAYSGSLYPSDGGANSSGFAYWSSDTFSDDQYAELVVTAAAGSVRAIGPGVRISNSANSGYALRVNFTEALELGKVTAGVWSSLGTYGTFVSGATYRIEISGTSIVCKENGTTRISVTDSSFSSGYGGLYGLGDDDKPVGDLFETGNLATSTLDQFGFRWRLDDGSETTATWAAAQNAAP